MYPNYNKKIKFILTLKIYEKDANKKIKKIAIMIIGIKEMAKNK